MEQTEKNVIRAEICNALTHGVGAILAIMGTILLILKGQSIVYGTADLVGFIVYGLSLIALFTASTLYHAFFFWEYQYILQKIDHACIYLLIAGSYTPFLITAIGGTLGMVALIIIWLIAIAGIAFEIGFTGRFPKLSTFLYLGMGWISLIMIYPLYQSVELPALIWLALGGIAYSVGTIFYKQKDNPWMHVIWHLFVLAGAGCMYIGVFFYL